MPGKNLTVNVEAEVQEDIKVGQVLRRRSARCCPGSRLMQGQDGAYADVVVKLGLIKLLTKRFDVCEEA